MDLSPGHASIWRFSAVGNDVEAVHLETVRHELFAWQGFVWIYILFNAIKLDAIAIAGFFLLDGIEVDSHLILRGATCSLHFRYLLRECLFSYNSFGCYIYYSFCSEWAK